MNWQAVALGYVSYLAAVSMTKREFAPARRPLLIAAALAWVAYAMAPAVGRNARSLGPALDVVLPAVVLLIGYWLSGLLFVRTDARIERWLHSIDRRVLTHSGVLDRFRRAPLLVQEYFETSYLLVYPAIPAGALVLLASGHADQIGRFWTIVLLAEFACYGMLPWIQTRPPRILEASSVSSSRPVLVRRLNHAIVNHASIQANTVPSGHAAGAFATALAVGSVMPVTGAVFLVIAISIAAATVLGRYHYVVDTVLGVLVAAISSALAAN
jgi:hypothetical protein